MQPAFSPSITVGIPHHADGEIASAIRAISLQTYRPIEIIIATDILKLLDLPIAPQIQVRQFGGLPDNVSTKRNVCGNNAKGDLIAFTDPDCIPDKDWLQNAVRYFADDNIIGVEGMTYSDISEGNFAPLSLTAGETFATNNIMYRRWIFDRIQFDPVLGLPSCEDIDFGLRAKKYGHIKWTSDARVYHHPHFFTKFQALKKYFTRRSVHVLVYRKWGRNIEKITASAVGGKQNILYVLPLLYGSLRYRAPPPLTFALRHISAEATISDLKRAWQSARSRSGNSYSKELTLRDVDATFS